MVENNVTSASVDIECVVFNPKPSALPTSAPTVNFVEFSASQVINGISFSTYTSDPTNYQLTLTNSIAACMEGISASDITNLVVSSYSGSRRSLLSIAASTSTAISASYVVTTHAAGVTYNSLSSQLTNNIATGVFDTNLNTYSAIYSTPGFVNTTSNSVTTVNLVDNSDGGNDGLSTTAVIGIAIGATALGIIVIAAFSYCYIYKYNRSANVVNAKAGLRDDSTFSTNNPAAKAVPVLSVDPTANA